MSETECLKCHHFYDGNSIRQCSIDLEAVEVHEYPDPESGEIERHESRTGAPAKQPCPEYEVVDKELMQKVRDYLGRIGRSR